MTCVCKKNQLNHIQPDPHTGLLAPSLVTVATQLAELRVSISAGTYLGKPNGAVFHLFKSALSLPSSMPHRKPEL